MLQVECALGTFLSNQSQIRLLNFSWHRKRCEWLPVLLRINSGVTIWVFSSKFFVTGSGDHWYHLKACIARAEIDQVHIQGFGRDHSINIQGIDTSVSEMHVGTSTLLNRTGLESLYMNLINLGPSNARLEVIPMVPAPSHEEL